MEGLFNRKEKCVVSNENNKKAIGIYEQNNNFARASRFFYISLPSLHDCDMKITNFTLPLYGVGEHNKKNFKT